MDISRYAAKPEAYDALSAYQIANFFKEHGLARDEVDCFATNLLGSPVSATPVQGATSYTVSGSEAAQVVQFRRSQLPMRHIEVAKQLYGDFVPEYLVPGPAFCQVRSQFFSPAPTMEQRLQQTVQDFARFFALAWINKPACTLEPPPGLLSEYFEILDEISPGLPAQLKAILDDVRQELPRLFQSSYPMVLQHDDLLENNIHVDEATGHITGIIDWADAKIAPFGVSLASMEVVLGIQTRTDWHFHPNHHSLRQLFWKTFYGVTGHISKDDRRLIEVARLFGIFREHGREEKEHAVAYLSALCLL
ncbi:Protein kinase-like domain protein [Fusarium austroafricanum]|uniref:Protein kinase-like domain protein n=1 Tax=Fusarium austroafricanum TaxID=2364996 RepID=A0A8H4JS53_9HYPO|nr:Protein kinase-like domain protein [Fusarium austroafricanum]